MSDFSWETGSPVNLIIRRTAPLRDQREVSSQYGNTSEYLRELILCDHEEQALGLKRRKQLACAWRPTRTLSRPHSTMPRQVISVSLSIDCSVHPRTRYYVLLAELGG